MHKRNFTFCLISILSITNLQTTAHALSASVNNGEHQVVNNEWDLGIRGTLAIGNTTDGSVTVDANGIIKASLINIGTYGGNGQLDIINGGQVNIHNDNSYSYPLAIGGRGESGSNSQGSTGILNIIGSGSKLNFGYTPGYSSGEISIGSSGATGILNVFDGGQFIANTQTGDGVWIGGRGSSTTQGTVNVDGAGSLFYTNGRILVGTYNEGQLNVTNGGTVISDSYISVARAVTDKTVDNVLYISGTGSLVQAASYVDTGYNGKGTIIVSDNGKLSASNIIIANGNGMPGELAIGSRTGQAPTAAGIIDVPTVQFGRGQGQLVFNHTNQNYDFAPSISGNGTVNLLSGTTTLTSANNTYSGTTTVSANATLQAGAVNTFSPNSDYVLDTQGNIDLNGHNQTMNSLSNAGTLYFSQNGSTAGTVLSITGDYVGQNGTLVMNGVLGEDTSLVDRLEIAGNATGTTNVQVHNLGGNGAQTVEGLHIIDIGGTSNHDAFVQDGRIVAGAYDYQLVQGNTSQSDTQGWYLTSLYAPPPPPTPPSNLNPGDTGGNGNSGSNGSNSANNTQQAPGVRVIRPEGAAYLSNLAAANTMFNLRLHDRQNEVANASDAANTSNAASFTPWVRYDYRHNDFKDSSGQLSSKGRSNVIQIGTSLFEHATENHGRVNIGVMGGYGRYSGDSTNALNGYKTSNKLQGYQAGIYGTWYGQTEQKGGPYVDTWLMWNHFNADVNGQGLTQESYHLNGLSASIEAGYTINAGHLGNYNTWVEPQVQLVWMGVKPRDHRETNGTLITGQENNIQTRVGARFSASPDQDTASQTTFAPYLEANWLHNTRPYSINMDAVSVGQAGSRNIAEIRTGMRAKFGNNTHLWFDLGYQAGSNSYKSTQFRIGLNYSF